jgi:autotransporter-associated beta strand repeat
MKSTHTPPITGNFPRATPVVAALLLGLSAPLGHAVDNFWSGAVSSDWNDGANWSEGGVPDTLFGDNAVVATTTPNIATITADISATPNDIIVTGGGRIDQQAGIAGTFGGAWMFVGQDSTPSVYNLADTSTPGAGITGYAQGTGTLNPSGNLQVGSWGADRNGTININTTEGVNVAGGLFIANDNNCVGIMNLETGAVTVLHEPGFATDNIQVGHNGGNGTLNISGGSLSASRNFRVGNEGGTGAVNLTGGSLLIGGTDDMFIGRDRGTAVVNQSAGVIDFNHNTFIANGNNATDPTSGTYNLDGGTLNIRREFAIGREGTNATGTLNMTGGTITKTGDEKMIVGQNNGQGFVVQSGGTINVNNELFIGNENAGASGTYMLSGTGALNVSNEVVVGRESGTGVLQVDGGTITTTGNGNMFIGRKLGTGTLTQTAGTLNVNREFAVGASQDSQGGTGTYNLSGGSLSVTNDIFVGKEVGSSGIMTMTDGTITTTDKLQIGYNQATGVFSQSGGTVNVQNEIYVGNETTNAPSVGTYTISDAAVVNVGNEVVVGRDNGTGVLNLNGGSLNANKISGGSGSATVNFNGGVLQAKRDEGNLIENLDVANLAGGGLKIDSNGFNVTTSQFFTGTGGLEKSGAGQLTLRAPSTYAGTTTVTAGVLRVEKTGLNAIVDATADTLVAEFAAPTAPGAYRILPGPLAGSQTFTATGLGSLQQATFDAQTSTVTVTGEPDGDPYAGWIESFTPNPLLPDDASKLPTADPDGDGIANLMEYVLAGGNPVVPSLSILPTVASVGDDLVLSYTRNDESEADTTQVGQWTTDLTVWNDVVPVVVNENGALADDMTVTVPKSNAVNGKLFLRLKVTMP